MDKNTKIKRVLNGEVISDKMDKTRVVAVTRFVKHPKYGKTYKVMKKFKADDAQNKYKKGDLVNIKEIRPMSKDKRWLIIGLVENKNNKKQ